MALTMLKMAARIDLGNATRFLERARRALRAALARASRRGLLLLEQRVVENIRAPFGGKPPAVAYGTLAPFQPVSESATGAAWKGAGTGLAGSVFHALHHRPELGGVVAVHPPADVYAAAVEFGARPHFPPLRSLFPWVRAKFALAGEKQIESRAFLVARAIARRGTSGHFMFQRAVESEKETVNVIFDQEIERAITDLEA